MKLLEKLESSSILLDEFESNINLPKNTKNIIKLIDNIKNDLSGYATESKKTLESIDKEKENYLIIGIIKKIDNLNKVVASKVNLSNEFKEYNSLK